MHGLNKTTDDMAKHLTEGFVDLRSARLAPERISELRLNHHKGGLDIRTLVVLLHEPLLVVREEVVHLLPKRN